MRAFSVLLIASQSLKLSANEIAADIFKDYAIAQIGSRLTKNFQRISTV